MCSGMRRRRLMLSRSERKGATSAPSAPCLRPCLCVAVRPCALGQLTCLGLLPQSAASKTSEGAATQHGVPRDADIGGKVRKSRLVGPASPIRRSRAHRSHGNLGDGIQRAVKSQARPTTSTTRAIADGREVGASSAGRAPGAPPAIAASRSAHAPSSLPCIGVRPAVTSFADDRAGQVGIPRWDHLPRNCGTPA